jgi:hypothetical protein
MELVLDVGPGAVHRDPGRLDQGRQPCPRRLPPGRPRRRHPNQTPTLTLTITGGHLRGSPAFQSVVLRPQIANLPVPSSGPPYWTRGGPGGSPAPEAPTGNQTRTGTAAVVIDVNLTATSYSRI